MELDRLTARALAGVRWAATFRPALYPLVRAGRYGPPNPDRLTTAARTLAEWLAFTWRPVDIETLPTFGPQDYPKRLAALHFEAGIAHLDSQHAQATALDSKLAVAGATALAMAALILSALSIFDPLQQALGGTELLLISAGSAVLFFAFVNSVRGLWPRTYRELPSLSDIRELAATKEIDEDVHWLVAASVEQAVAVNERVMKARVATTKLTYSSMMLGAALIVAGFGPHIPL